MITVMAEHTASHPDKQMTKADPLLRAIFWQAGLTVVGVLAFTYLFGLPGGVSAVLGGGVSILSSLVFRWLMQRSQSLKMMDTLFSMLRAEAAKVAVIVAGLLLSFVLYKDAIALALVATFIATTLVFICATFMSGAARPAAGATRPDAS